MIVISNSYSKRKQAFNAIIKDYWYIKLFNIQLLRMTIKRKLSEPFYVSIKYNENVFLLFHKCNIFSFFYISDNMSIFTVTECFLKKTKSIILVDMPIFTVGENIIGAPKNMIIFGARIFFLVIPYLIITLLTLQ